MRLIKNFIIIGLFVNLLLLSSFTVKADYPETQEISNRATEKFINDITVIVLSNDSSKLRPLFSKNISAEELTNTFDTLDSKTVTDFRQEISSVEPKDGYVEVKVKYSIEARSNSSYTSSNGLTMHYKLVNEDGEYKILESDLDELYSIKLIFIVIIAVSVILSILLTLIWVGFIIDCMKRDIDGNDKLIWILILLFLQLFGIILYIFIVPSKYPKKKN